jgi:hypothetical protein
MLVIHSEMHVGHVKCPLLLSTFNQNWDTLTNFSKKGTILWDVMPCIPVEVSQKTAFSIVTAVTNVSKTPHYKISWKSTEQFQSHFMCTDGQRDFNRHSSELQTHLKKHFWAFTKFHITYLLEYSNL